MNGEARNFLQASGRVFYHPESREGSLWEY